MHKIQAAESRYTGLTVSRNKLSEAPLLARNYGHLALGIGLAPLRPYPKMLNRSLPNEKSTSCFDPLRFRFPRLC